MSVADQIDQMRGEFPACRSITFTDLATGLVLCSATREKVRQERLDHLSERAKAILDGESGQALVPALGGGDLAAIGSVVVYDAERTLVFIRSASEPDEGLACDCDPSIDVAALLERAQSELAAIGSAH